MKVHSSQSSYSAPLLSQSYSDSDDDTPFVLPDDDDSSQKKTAPSISSAGISNSISSGFWLNQSGGSKTEDSSASASDTSASDAAASDDDILSEFAKWANMTPADKIREQYLAQQNLTEEQFAQLPPDQQKAISDKIADQIKQQLGAGKTANSDDDSDGGSASVSLG